MKYTTQGKNLPPLGELWAKMVQRGSRKEAKEYAERFRTHQKVVIN